MSRLLNHMGWKSLIEISDSIDLSFIRKLTQLNRNRYNATHKINSLLKLRDLKLYL